ncbi:polysaccharide pyruvyl transferase family protein [Opitutales bacterium]|nr:polysaccharide pyruvyl transferase family protein [Opitutales bacterium]
MKILLAAVMYSPNLGDGAIAECFSREYENICEGNKVEWLDFAGRSSFRLSNARLRTCLLSGLHTLPKPLSNSISAKLVSKQIVKRLQPKFDSKFNKTKGLVIGGGQIFADEGLNFPLKFAAIANEARMRKVPISIHGVGLSNGWSRRAKCLYAEVFQGGLLKSVAVRDETSKFRLKAYLNEMGVAFSGDILVFPDPAFMACETHPVVLLEKNGKPPTVGIGVIHPVVFKKLTNMGSAFSVYRFAEKYIDLAKSLVAEGFRVRFFTTGSGEDELMLGRVSSIVTRMNSECVDVITRPANPMELMSVIANFDVLVAHRMHANILSYSYGVPHVGLRWDDKMDAFFNLIERSSLLLDGRMSKPSEIAASVVKAFDQKIEGDLHSKLVHDAKRGVQHTSDALAL